MNEHTSHAGQVIRNSDLVYLRYQGDRQRSFADAYEGAQWYPTAQSNVIKLRIEIIGDDEELTTKHWAKIRTTEEKVTPYHTLGAFADKTNLYYSKDEYGKKQHWRFTLIEHRDDKRIKSGDRVAINNGSYVDQRMIAEGQYFTTKHLGDEAYFVIEKA